MRSKMEAAQKYGKHQEIDVPHSDPSTATMFMTPSSRMHGMLSSSASRNWPEEYGLGGFGVGVTERPHVDGRFREHVARRLDLHRVPAVLIDADGSSNHHPERLEIVDPAVLPVLRPVSFEARGAAPERVILGTLAGDLFPNRIEGGAGMFDSRIPVRRPGQHDGNLRRRVRRAVPANTQGRHAAARGDK